MPPMRPTLTESQIRSWHMWVHLSSLSGYIGVPFGNFLGPVLLWQIKKAEIPSIDSHGKAALNFQITVWLALLVCGAAVFSLAAICIGFLLIPVLIAIAICGVIFPIIAAIKANEGKEYRYPYTLELLK
jgi:uncharacterized Tic20 family protein